MPHVARVVIQNEFTFEIIWLKMSNMSNILQKICGGTLKGSSGTLWCLIFCIISMCACVCVYIYIYIYIYI